MTDTTNTPVQIPGAAVTKAANYIALGIDNGSTPRAIAENALTAALPHLPLGYEVKKLDWEPSIGGKWIRATGMDRTYEVRASDSRCEELKAAAQADFDRRVKSCIEGGVDVAAFPQDPTGQMIDAALKVDWSNEDERATVINIWHAMNAFVPSASSKQSSLNPVQWLREIWHGGDLTVEDFNKAEGRLSALSAEPAQGEQWSSDIDNAPTGETLLLACANWPLVKCGREVPVKAGYKSFGTWVVFGASWTPTHWMPLPAAPTPETEA